MKKLLLGMLVVAALLPQAFALASGGQLYLTPTSGIYSLGKTFDVQVLANTGGTSVNAIEAELAYNPLDLEVEHISTDNSILGSWSTAPADDPSSGLINFSGWAGSNYNGANGLLITITFKPLKVAESSLDFNSGAMLDAGTGSNIITSMRSGAYGANPEQIAAPVVPSAATTTPVQTQTQTPQILPSTVPAASPLPSPGTTSQAAAIAYSGADFAWQYIPFFGILALIAFLIAYYFHRKNIAF